ncbi:Motility protein B [Methylophilaceae bacterium]|nr:Motility protein B [Methylophilaceae bacterium]
MSSRPRKFEVERENHDRWLVSYADFITLLFAFFVVMYAVSAVNQNKYEQLANSLGSAFGTTRAVQNIEQEGTSSPGGAYEPKKLQMGSSFIKPFPALKSRNDKWLREREAMTAMALDVSRALSSLSDQGKVRVVQNNRGIRIDIESSILFAPGSAELENSSLEPLLEVAALLVDKPHAIQVEGHTDTFPIHNYLFYSNWELSAVRASSVVRLLALNGVAEHRLSAVGYGSSQPVTDNETAEGRAKNRRVSIMVLYDTPESANDGAEIKYKRP